MTADAPAPSLLAVAVRRWPVVAVALAFGLAGGLLLHLQRPRVYQSAAQVLVKKRGDAGPAAGRLGAVEDHVAAQVPLLKSDYLLSLAARRLDPPAGVPLPETDDGRAAVLAAGLGVARDTTGGTAATPGPAGSGVLVLTFRSASPDASRACLAAVIAAYQAELATVYDEATRKQLADLDAGLRSFQREQESLRAARGAKLDDLRRATDEEVSAVRGRVSALTDKELSLELERSALDRQLALIAAAGRDRGRRLAALAQLTTQAKPDGPARPDLDAPEVTLRALEAQRRELGQRLGKDHPELAAVESKLGFYRTLYAAQNPDAPARPAWEADELWAVEQRLRQQRETAADQLARVSARLARDRATLAAAARLQDDVDQLGERIAGRDRDIDAHRGQIIRLESAHGSGGYAAQVISDPKPGVPVAPVLWQAVAVGGFVGLCVGGGLAALADRTDRGFRSPAELEGEFGLPAVGHLPRLAGELSGSEVPGLAPELAAAHRPRSAGAEAVRGVRTRLFARLRGRGPAVLLVTSPAPGDGKSTVAANLAVSAARAGRRVLLADADFRRPRVHTLFGLPADAPGFAAALAAGESPVSGVVPSAVENLHLLPCGPRPVDPGELFAGPAVADAVADLRGRYDLVLLDAPPLLAVADPAALAPLADGVLLVLRPSRQARPLAGRARDALAAVGATVLGVVVNGADGDGGGYAYPADYRHAEGYAAADGG